MDSVKWCLDVVFLLFEKLKGQQKVEELHSTQTLVGHLTGYSVAGYEIRLFCQKRRYLKKYSRWFVPDQIHTLYHVYSSVSNDAPANLKTVCELDLNIPAMTPSFVSEKLQKEAAIHAYLDILIAKLKQQAVPV